MFPVLGLLFILIIAILILGLSVIATVIRSIFGLGRRRAPSGSYKKPGGSSYTSSRHRPGSSSRPDEAVEAEEDETRPKRKKLFSKDEGEYVDFEEIKD